ncbi:MAG: aliphatic nitrilase, partial [Actinomycetospora chiangmaiensis]|nr:aliphatic nitrilase [Actinomycetospora chiangmaiensis]
QIFADQMEVTIRHHALEAACFVVNATGWLTDEQVAQVCPDERLRGACRGGNCTAIVSPEGKHLAEPLGPGEGILIADMDLALVTKRKRMMDSVGHYARPELLSLLHDDRSAAFVHQPAGAQTASRSLDHEQQPVPDEPSPRAAGRDGADRDADGAPDQRVAILRR